jgi:hypothetical protein
MNIELYHYTLTYKNKQTNVIKTMVGAIRATSRNHALERLNDKVSNLRLGIYEVIAFKAKTANQMAKDLTSNNVNTVTDALVAKYL